MNTSDCNTTTILNMRRLCLGISMILALRILAFDSPSSQAAEADASMVVGVRRATESQYRNAIADIFSPEIVVNARFEPDPRIDGLLAIGANDASISAAGFQGYFAAAESIAAQVLSEDGREEFLDCRIRNPGSMNESCAEEFLSQYGRLLYRRPLTEEELESRVRLVEKGTGQAEDLYSGLRLGLVSLLTSPEFLFRVERAITNDDGQLELDAYSRAARISYLFWDAPPDAKLLEAAEEGELMNERGLRRQVARYAESDRVQDGVRAFFSDLLQLDLFDNLNKDTTQYPKFSGAVASSAKEQTLKVVVDLLGAQRRDYRDIFTSRETFINRELGAIYKVPFASNDEWVRYTFDEASGQSGVLTQVSFTSLFSHPGRTSPTKRGAAINEMFLCQTIPQPPADVDLSALNDDSKAGATTVRERLEAHRTAPLCTSCHVISDPPGLALEQFDGIGQFRLQENGINIDVSVEFDNKAVSGAQGLGQALREDARVPACLVNRVWAYGQGRASRADERSQLAELTEAFATDGYRFPDLLTRLATSEQFYVARQPLSDDELTAD